MAKEKWVVGIGEALWDLLPDGAKIGGAPANFAFHAGQFGLKALAISALGDDALGDETEKVLREKLDIYMERVPFPTGTVNVTLDGKGVPQYEIREDVAWDNIPLTERLTDIARESVAVCFGSLAQRNPVSRAAIRAFLAAMPEDAMKIFDINLRQHFYGREVVENSLELCNILKINDEELAIVARMFEIDDLPPQRAVPPDPRLLRPRHGHPDLRDGRQPCLCQRRGEPSSHAGSGGSRHRRGG